MRSIRKHTCICTSVETSTPTRRTPTKIPQCRAKKKILISKQNQVRIKFISSNHFLFIPQHTRRTTHKKNKKKRSPFWGTRKKGSLTQQDVDMYCFSFTYLTGAGESYAYPNSESILVSSLLIILFFSHLFIRGGCDLMFPFPKLVVLSLSFCFVRAFVCLWKQSKRQQDVSWKQSGKRGTKQRFPIEKETSNRMPPRIIKCEKNMMIDK